MRHLSWFSVFGAAVCCLLLACDSWTAVSCCEANGGVIKLCGSLGVPRFTPARWVGSLSGSTFRSQTSQPALRNEPRLRSVQTKPDFVFVNISTTSRVLLRLSALLSPLLCELSQIGDSNEQLRVQSGPLELLQCQKCSKLLNTFSFLRKTQHSTCWGDDSVGGDTVGTSVDVWSLNVNFYFLWKFDSWKPQTLSHGSEFGMKNEAVINQVVLSVFVSPSVLTKISNTTGWPTAQTTTEPPPQLAADWLLSLSPDHDVDPFLHHTCSSDLQPSSCVIFIPPAFPSVSLH